MRHGRGRHRIAFARDGEHTAKTLLPFNCNRILLPMIREKTTEILNGYVNVPRVTEEMDQYICRSVFSSNSGIVGALSLGSLALEEARDGN
mmetsp:Transcript_21457/g.87597  ORF Transcript_21457/g.87597 Transcript_21457/m.87597 type:complete len:91 (+) Transcript_21457:1193-1465(+)